MRIVNPATDEVLREVAADDAATIGAKLAQARAAQPVWARTPVADRQAVLARFRALVAARIEPLARILTEEVGKPIAQSRRELTALLDRIDWFVTHVPGVLADEVVHREAGLEERIRREPLGVVANVSAWNYPWFVGASVFVPALLTGNAVLYKPSELATLTGLEIAGLLAEAGVPDGVFGAVLGDGAAGQALVEQRVDGVFFTGSYATGARIAAAVAPRMIRLQLELGGKDPVYVCEDVDPAAAAAAVADGAFYNTGQSCCAVERIYVQRRIWEPFLEAFVSAVCGFRLGDPLDDSTYIGPLARRAPQVELLTRQVGDAVAKGARVLTGGARVERRGHFFAPTVLVDVDHRMQVMREESFGPVIGLMPVTDDDEALGLVRDTDYGLTAAVYTADRARAERLLAEVGVGTAYWNCCDRVSPRLPWSGRGHSGVGATLAADGIRAFLAPKAWHLRSPA